MENRRHAHDAERPNDPFRLARTFLDDMCRDDAGRITLRYHNGEWYRYRQSHYMRIDEGTIGVEVTGYIKAYFDANHCVDTTGHMLRVTKALVGNTLNAVASLVAVGDEVQMPVWLGAGGQRSLVAMRNGLLDLTDLSQPLKKVENTPEWFSTVLFPYDYVEDAACPRWLQFLDEVMEGDPERIALIQEWFGYCLTPNTSHHKFLVAEGEGDNGKSVMLNVLMKLLGEQNVSQVPLEIFGARFQLTSTIGKLANICAEIGEISVVAEGFLKQFTAGDRMHFDRKGIAAVEHYPTARLVLATNNRPRFRDRSDGIWRRMILVPFRFTVRPDKKDPNLIEKLQKELSGIFLWALEGLERLRVNGRFTEPAACRQVLDDYRLESNPARVFLDESVMTFEGKALRCTDLYEKYVVWSKQNGFESLNAAQFGKEVGKRFPAAKRTRIGPKTDRVWCYVGLVYQPHVPSQLVLAVGRSMRLNKTTDRLSQDVQKPVCEVH